MRHLNIKDKIIIKKKRIIFNEIDVKKELILFQKKCKIFLKSC